MDIKSIKGKVCGLIAGGNSLDEFESRILEFKDLPIEWVGLNNFTIAEDNILKKINKQFNVVFDSATVTYYHEYEPNYRIPKYREYLGRKDSFLITADRLLLECFLTYAQDLYNKYKNKIFNFQGYLEENFVNYSILTKRPPNSLAYAIGSLILGQAKKVIIFGFDGISREVNLKPEKILNTYYKPELVKVERKLGFGEEYEVGGIVAECENFDREFPELYINYRKAFGCNTELVICSPKTIIKSIRKINYNQLEDEL